MRVSTDEYPGGPIIATLQCILQYFANIFQNEEPGRWKKEPKVRIRRCASGYGIPDKLRDNSNFSVINMPELARSTRQLSTLIVDENCKSSKFNISRLKKKLQSFALYVIHTQQR